MRLSALLTAITLCFSLLSVVSGSDAQAYSWSRTLREGDSGSDVRELQIRVLGWVNTTAASHRTASLDGNFGPITTRAVKNFQSFYGLTVDGIVGPQTHAKLNSLEDGNGTIHFNFGEFADKGCGCFTGGKVGQNTVREHLRRVMYRMEVVRAKQGNNPVYINSGFRTSARNSSVGGAAKSQHTYGTAIDNRIPARGNRSARNNARASAFSAIFCYSGASHNHFDTRSNNNYDGITNSQTQDPYRASRDSRDRDIKTRQLCQGEGTNSAAATNPDLYDGAVTSPDIQDTNLLYLDTDEDGTASLPDPQELLDATATP